MPTSTTGGPGWKTSEFWMTTILSVIGILGLAKGLIPPPYSGYVIMAITVLNGIYNIMRTLLKKTDSTSASTTTAIGPATITTTTTKP